MAKGSQSVLNTGEISFQCALKMCQAEKKVGKGETNTSWDDFGELFLSSFQATHAHEVWDRITDPILFDIIEPKYAVPVRFNYTSLIKNFKTPL